MNRHDDPGTPAVTLTKAQEAEYAAMQNTEKKALVLIEAAKKNTLIDMLVFICETENMLADHQYKMETYLSDLGITEL